MSPREASETWSQGVNPQLRGPTGQFCSGSPMQSPSGAPKPTGVLAKVSGQSAMTDDIATRKLFWASGTMPSGGGRLRSGERPSCQYRPHQQRYGWHVANRFILDAGVCSDGKDEVRDKRMRGDTAQSGRPESDERSEERRVGKECRS